MKRIALITLLLLTAFSASSQSRKDFFAFVDSFNWGQTEDAFKAKYASRIIPQTDSLVIGLELKDHSYLLNDLKIGDLDCYTIVGFEQETGTPSVIGRFTREILDSALPSILKNKADKIVKSKLGDPDMPLEGMPLASFGWEGFDGVDGNMYLWMTDALTFSTITATTEEGLLYLFIARKGEPREPDFRKGKWGDSMADCKKKEGKADQYNMEGIYAFDTYVAGISCIAAYRFTNDMLTSGKYVFQQQNTDNCIRNYEKLVDLLTTKYGEPTSQDTKNTAEEYQKRIYSEGELVRDGKITKETYWLTPFSTIAIFLNAERYSISLNIEYYGNKVDKIREEAILNDL